MISSTTIYYWIQRLLTRQRRTDSNEDSVSIEGTLTPLSTVPSPKFYSRRSCYGGHSYGLESNHSPAWTEYDNTGPEAITEEDSTITAHAVCASTVDTSNQIWPGVEVNIVDDEDSVPEPVEIMD
ncbi:hypothetical protein K438DRAFT_1764277 [Mycena galopus ATCC 62051]|nr:hypothetical protein K438DRAFT_1776634 [Mycena galopus ATCC 62051]KAF8188528.1 hypothetical protein K438DRAFT_1764277 [Mycena galopus ATCC 62051]